MSYAIILGHSDMEMVELLEMRMNSNVKVDRLTQRINTGVSLSQSTIEYKSNHKALNVFIKIK